MVKNHLKTIAAPKTWDIKRKDSKYVLRPSPSGHSMAHSVSLTMLFRDLLKKVKTKKELRYVLHSKDILVNNKKVLENNASVGLMDVISIPETKENFRIVFNKKGVIAPVEIDEKRAKLILLKVNSKTKIKSGKTQLNFSNGNNMIVDKDEYKTQDVLVYNLVDKKVEKVLKVEKGALVFFTSGRYMGTTATVEEIKEDTIVFKQGDEVFESDKKYAKKTFFAIGKGKDPIIKLAD